MWGTESKLGSGTHWLFAILLISIMDVFLYLINIPTQHGIHTLASLRCVVLMSMIYLLALLDLTLLANLILMVIFAGYENFVSRIDVATESKDRPHWMGTIDFSGLKIKLIGSLVAISVIELLKDFIELSGDAEVGEGTVWRVLIHLTFVLSGVLFALMDWIADKREFRGTH